MRHLVAAVSVMAVATWMTSPAKAAKQSVQSASVSAQVDLHATVESVDVAKRKVLLRDDEGTLETVTIGSGARNFAQVKAGDHVTVRFNLSVLTHIAPANGAGAPVAAAEFAGRTPEGAKPGGLVGDAVRVRVMFESYDANSKTVALTLPSGTQMTRVLHTAEMQTFASGLKRGDKVDVTFVRAIVIAVTPS
jgi:Cu/Ag efflux protein CusF